MKQNVARSMIKLKSRHINGVSMNSYFNSAIKQDTNASYITNNKEGNTIILISLI